MTQLETEAAPVVRFDMATLTLGEMDAVERLSGRTLSELLATTGGRLMLAVAISDLRTSVTSGNSDDRRSWSDITALRLLDVSR